MISNDRYTLEVVSIVTKIRILKQITTRVHSVRGLASCIYSNKDKNFKANHNQPESWMNMSSLYL